MGRLEKKDYILIVVLGLLSILLIIIVNQSNKDEDNIKDETNYIVVNNPSTFFTLEGCAYRYIVSLYNKNTTDLLKLLDNNYIKENLITKENVINKLGSLNGIFNFNAKKIYKEKLNNKYTKYYLYGLLSKDINGEYDYGTDYYLIIIVDEDNNLFSVIPYDGALFKESA